MKRLAPPLALLALCSPAFAQPPESPSSIIPPAFRAQRHFDEGANYLRALPEGTKITIQRLDGSSFVLALKGGKLTASIPAAKLTPDATVWTSPFGYRVFPKREAKAPGLTVVAPSGAWSVFSFFSPKILVVTEKRSGLWTWDLDSPLVLRLPDGTRIDFIESSRQWEAITLNGERFRLDQAKGVWTELPRLPSPPLIPDPKSIYVAGNGDHWRRPGQEDHVVFGWNWFPVGFSPSSAIEDVRTGFRRGDLDGYFNNLPMPQPPVEMAGCVLGRRLALGGGDQLTFELPDQPPTTVMLLPGPIDPDYFVLKNEYFKKQQFTPETAHAAQQ